MKPLHRGSTVALMACSEALKEREASHLDNLVNLLQAWGLRVLLSPLLRQKDSWAYPAKDRAEILMDAFLRPEVTVILDPSGGDSSNEILEFLDLEGIKNNPKPFFGHSDISVLLNGLQKAADTPTWHFQPLNLVGPFGETLSEAFSKVFLDGELSPEMPEVTLLRGAGLSGPLAGGNIRCFLKLAGTPFWPNLEGRVLLLESYGAEGPLLSSLLSHLKQIGVFEKVSGILLGTFSQWEKKDGQPTMEEMTLRLTEDLGLPVGKTRQIGHGRDALPIPFGVDLKWA